MTLRYATPAAFKQALERQGQDPRPAMKRSLTSEAEDELTEADL